KLPNAARIPEASRPPRTPALAIPHSHRPSSPLSHGDPGGFTAFPKRAQHTCPARKRRHPESAAHRGRSGIGVCRWHWFSLADGRPKPSPATVDRDDLCRPYPKIEPARDAPPAPSEGGHLAV